VSLYHEDGGPVQIGMSNKKKRKIEIRYKKVKKKGHKKRNLKHIL
jgi:hypothetical protein